ncbi:MAG: hypothetical protein LUO93_02155, partial [Methanomicrobiales archaeon]|nr:hypothetical protein [Methanomicrobiales archaeon]
MSLTRRALRHALPKIRAAFLSPAVFLIGYLCGSCLRYGWLWGQEQVEILPGVVAITCGLALLGVALLLAAEIDDLYQGWMRKQWVEDRYRCPVCDDPVK